jgi:hypothetical protein
MKLSDAPRWAKWLALVPTTAAALAVLWRIFLFAVSEADHPVVEQIKVSFEHLEEHAQQTDGWLRCRSELLARGAERDIADETCRQLFPQPEESDGR